MRKVLILLIAAIGNVMDVPAQVKTTDSTFIENSRPIIYVVNKTDINAQDREWITNYLIPQLEALGDRGIVLGRATASPEGPTPNNVRLARSRRASMDALLGKFGININRIRYDVVPEDYPLLLTLMQMEHDKQLPVVEAYVRKYHGKGEPLKAALKRHDRGRLWKYLLKKYFPQLRAVRIMPIDERLVDTIPLPEANLIHAELPFPKPHIYVEMPLPEPAPVIEDRRELLSIKTNLLYDFAYMPGYNRFCPIPNVGIEYYPLHGHFTYGASFEGPWWQNYSKHKYFQLRNYQLHTRYYLRSGETGFRGFFVSAYAHAYLYNICFGEKRGWEGEGWGAGMGLGWAIPLGRSKHWRLDIGLQAGFLNTRYDPYQWLCPIDPDYDKEQYYYKWYGDAKDFRKRKHIYNWMGPTRLEISLSYDLLYRRNHKKGVSFRSKEKTRRAYEE